MKRLLLTAAAVVALATSAFAADLKMPVKAAPPPSPWDIAFGGGLASDYIFRGITQSNHRPSVNAYTELRYNSLPTLQWYGGISGESISFPNRAAAEIDFYGGVRPTFGPLALDFGYWYYYYPGGQCFGFGDPTCAPALPNGFAEKADWSFWEVYAKGTWTINDQWALGFNVFTTPNILNQGASGTYVSGTAKFTAPAAYALFAGQVGWYVSGEFGTQFLGTTDAILGSIALNDYDTWNVGVGFTWKVFTLDLRYYDTDMSKADCATFTGAQNAAIGSSGLPESNWCDATFVAKLSFDLTLASLK